MSTATTSSKSAYQAIVPQAVEASRDDLIRISRDLHAHPELNYQEHHAAELLSDTLERNGFAVERGVGGVETAFRGTVNGGKGNGPTVAILVEYDADRTQKRPVNIFESILLQFG